MIPVVILLAVLGFTLARPFRLPEAVAAAVAGLWVGLRLWGT